MRAGGVEGPAALATGDHRAVEAEAAAVVEALGAPVLDEIVSLLVNAGPPAPVDRLRDYASELLWCTALQSVNSDPERPRIHWSLYPGARAGLDNPDTRYRFAPLSEQYRYRLRGRRNSSTDVSFQLFDGWQGDGAIGQQLGFLAADELVVDEAGAFEITFDADPSDGRSPHLHLPHGSAQLTIRDTLADWTLLPMELELHREEPHAVARTAPRPVAELAASTHDRVRQQAVFWPPVVKAFQLLPPNSVGPPGPTQGGLANQYSAAGRYALGDGDALVIRVGPGAARYFGIQLGSLQFISVDYWDRTTSLNLSQLVPDDDGTFTIVVSRRDPLVPNWLDPDDHDECIIFMRWQAMPGRLPATHHPRAHVVPLERVPAECGIAPTSIDRGAQLALRRVQSQR